MANDDPGSQVPGSKVEDSQVPGSQLFQYQGEPLRRGTPDSAGLDLVAAESATFEGLRLIPTNHTLIIPKGYVGIIKARSGLALKHGIQVLAGVIDSDYRKPVGVLLLAPSLFTVTKGDRIAQIVILPYLMMDPVPFDGEIDSDERGGFGSTGIQ